MIGRSEHSDSVNGYSLREEKAKEKYYEEKEKTDMGLTIQNLDAIKEATKQGYLEAMFEYEEYKKQRKSKKDPDLISTRQAYKMRGEGRVKKLIARGLLTRTSSGRASNAAKYVSKKRLLELDNTYLQ